MSRLVNRPPGSAPEVPGRAGVPWSDGQITVRVRGLGAEPSRIVRVRRPFALIGRHPGADLRIEDRAVAPRHAVLVLDRRGLFCVDLLTRTGTRFAGREIAAAWLGAGDLLEVAGRRLEILQLRADGSILDPTPGDDDLFAPAGPGFAAVSLRPVAPEAPPWAIASPLAFLGRGPACALRVEGLGASSIHCALWREPSSVRVIDLLGRTTLINDHPVVGSSPLENGDILAVGRARFVVGVEQVAESEREATENLPACLEPVPATVFTGAIQPGIPGLPPPEVVPPAPDLAEVMAFLQQFQSDAATLIEGQFDQILSLRRELAAMREDLRTDRRPEPEVHLPFQMEVPVNTAPSSSATAAWLLDRINDLEPESRSTWKDLLGRIASAVTSRGSAAASGANGSDSCPGSLPARRPEPS